MAKTTTKERNTATKLSEMDMLRVQNLSLRNALLQSDAEKVRRAQEELQAEVRKFEDSINVAYGNPDETLSLQPDGTIVRTPVAKQD